MEAVEGAVLRGLRKARMMSLGSGETGAQPDAAGSLPSPSADSADSPLDALLDAISEGRHGDAYDLGAAAEEELRLLRDLFFEYVGTDFTEVIARRLR